MQTQLEVERLQELQKQTNSTNLQLLEQAKKDAIENEQLKKYNRLALNEIE